MFAVAAVGSVLVSWSGRYWLRRGEVIAAARFFTGLLAAGCLGMGVVGFAGLGLPGLVAVSFVFGLGTTGCSVSANALVGSASAPPALEPRPGIPSPPPS